MHRKEGLLPFSPVPSAEKAPPMAVVKARGWGTRQSGQGRGEERDVEVYVLPKEKKEAISNQLLLLLFPPPPQEKYSGEEGRRSEVPMGPMLYWLGRQRERTEEAQYPSPLVNLLRKFSSRSLSLCTLPPFLDKDHCLPFLSTPMLREEKKGNAGGKEELVHGRRGERPLSSARGEEKGGGVRGRACTQM